MTEEKIKEETKSIRSTLKARLIPNMPADVEGSHGKASGYGNIRTFVRDTIDRFEFEYHLKVIQQQTAKAIFDDLHKKGLQFEITNDDVLEPWFIYPWEDWEELKKKWVIE